MRNKVKMLAAAVLAAAGCTVLTGCDEFGYGTDQNEYPDGVSVTVTVTGSVTDAPAVPYALSEEETAASLNMTAQEISQWLDEDICENGFDRLAEFSEIRAEEGVPSYTYEEIMALLSESVEKKEAFFDAMYENRNTSPELYEAWRTIDREIENCMEQARAIELEGVLDTSKLHEACEQFYARLAEMGLASSKETEVWGSESVGGSQTNVGSEPVGGSSETETQPAVSVVTPQIKYAFEGAQVFLSPSEISIKIADLSESTEISVVDELGDWYVIALGNAKAYVKKSEVADEDPATMTETTSGSGSGWSFGWGSGSASGGSSLGTSSGWGSGAGSGSSGSGTSTGSKTDAGSKADIESAGSSQPVVTTTTSNGTAPKATTTTPKTNTSGGTTTTTKKAATTTTAKKTTTTTTTKKKTTTTTTTKKTTTTTTTTKKATTTTKASTTTKTTTTKAVSTEQSYINEVLKLVNEERAKEGLSPLKLDDKLCQAAKVRAKEQAQVFGHTRPDGSSCFTVFDDFDIDWLARAENVASGYKTPSAVMNGWMSSTKGHRENILSTKYTHIGIGYYNDGTTSYWVQEFCKY